MIRRNRAEIIFVNLAPCARRKRRPPSLTGDAGYRNPFDRRTSSTQRASASPRRGVGSAR